MRPKFSISKGFATSDQALVVQKVDRAIHRTNQYPLDYDSAIGFTMTYPLDSDLSSG